MKHCYAPHLIQQTLPHTQHLTQILVTYKITKKKNFSSLKIYLKFYNFGKVKTIDSDLDIFVNVNTLYVLLLPIIITGFDVCFCFSVCKIVFPSKVWKF